MKTEEGKSSIHKFVLRGESFYGQLLKIKEEISTQEVNFDRHFTTYNYSEFVLISLSVRFSGARLMFEGEKMHYEISIDCIESINETNPLQFEFLEKYSDKVYRRTVIKIESNQ